MATGEIIWRHDPEAGPHQPQPASAAEARERLERGNAAFAALGDTGGAHVIQVGPDALGLPREPGEANPQEPFAAVLGCSDARVPVEFVFGQGANDLFVMRVAGGVPGTECVGSLHYAVDHLPSLRLVTVLGHTRCGAVAAAVDAFLAPETYLEVVHTPELRAIVDAVLAGVRMAALALTEVHGDSVTSAGGYRAALVETAVVANAAITASVVGRSVSSEVVFGVFDLTCRVVGLPGSEGWTPGLAEPRHDHAGIGALLRDAAAGVGLDAP
jgi:carbonic anhydrase